MLETSTSDWGDGAPTALTSSGSSATPNLGGGTPYFDIKINEVSPSEVSGMDVNQIMDILHNLDVDGVTEAAEAHMNLGDTLDQVASRLAQNAHTLAASWQGTAAQAAMDKFQQMHIQTAQLAAQSKQTGQVLHWTAGVMQKYKNLPTPQGESATQADEQTGSHIGGEIGGAPGSLVGDGIGAIAGAFGVGGGNQAKANAQAQKYLTALNQHLVAANNALPSTIGAPSDWIGSTGLGPAATGGSGGASGAGGVASAPSAAPFSGAGAGSGAGPAGPAHISKFNPAPLPHGGATPVRTPHSYTPPPAGTLQSYTPPPGGTSTLPPPSTTPPPGGSVGGGNIPTFTPGGPLPNSTNVPNRNNDVPSDEPPTEDGAAADGLAADGMPEVPGIGNAGSVAAAESGAGSAIGSEGADGEIGAADTSAMGAEGEGMGFPMTGGSGSGQQDKERQRQAWMNEDADIWGVPKDNVGPVIEGRD